MMLKNVTGFKLQQRIVLQRNDFNHEDTKKCGEAEKEAITVELRNVDNSIVITSS